MPKPRSRARKNCERCDRPAHARNLCQSHYDKWRYAQVRCAVCGGFAKKNAGEKRGCRVPVCYEHEHYSLRFTYRPSTGMYHELSGDQLKETLAKWAKQIEPDGQCWIWTGRKQRRGSRQAYGRFKVGERIDNLAHRFGYVFFYGGHEDNAQLDHLCNRPLCVRPDHLAPITGEQNTALRDYRRALRGERASTGTDLAVIPPSLMMWVMEWNKAARAGGEGAELPLSKSTECPEFSIYGSTDELYAAIRDAVEVDRQRATAAGTFLADPLLPNP